MILLCSVLSILEEDLQLCPTTKHQLSQQQASKGGGGHHRSIVGTFLRL